MMAKFTDIFEDVTKQGTKIPANLYLETGMYPIIDQGQSQVAGYTNETEGLFTDIPAIIFGDHTRIIKYVDTPCFLGADGVKLLIAKDPTANYKYLYYALCNADIPNTGYNRHFKWLKEIEIPEYSMEQQNSIVSQLEKIDNLIALRKQQLAKLDELVKSRFIEMFGDRYTNDKKWDNKPLRECADFYNGKAHEQVVDENGEYILVTSRCIASDISDYRRTNTLLFPLQVNDIAMVMSDVPNGRALAKCVLIDEDGKYTLNQRICCLRNYSFNPIFFYHLLNRHEYFLSFNDGNAQTNLRKDDLLACNIIIPPMKPQEQFAAFVEQIDKSKLAVQKSLEKLETLKKALMQKYFG